MRRRESLRIVETCVKEIIEDEKQTKMDPLILQMQEVCTDDDNEEDEYDGWKLRELKRMKKDREEMELARKEAADVQRRRNMTDEELRWDLRTTPRVITNKSMKGRYKFMQKYYHKGSFYMEKDEQIYSRDFSSATLEDQFESPWVMDTPQNLKFQLHHAAAMKSSFERPSSR